jgi:hypothetical protein
VDHGGLEEILFLLKEVVAVANPLQIVHSLF